MEELLPKLSESRQDLTKLTSSESRQYQGNHDTNENHPFVVLNCVFSSSESSCLGAVL